jgi:hypothetical protein
VPLEFDHSTRATIPELVARREATNFYAKALAVLSPDEAVLFRRVEPKHCAAHGLAQGT